MADVPVVAAADPFNRRRGRVASLARRLGCTEGQLYSVAIGLVFVWTVLANSLPDVAWDGSGAGTPAPFALAEPAATAERPGLLEAPPLAEPVVVPVPAVPARAGSLPRPTAPASNDVDDDGGVAAPPAVDDPPETDPGAPTPIAVTGGGYASAQAGTPLAGVGVPEGSVAVGRKAGQDDAIAYLSLSGTGGSLELEVDPDGVNVLDPLAGLTLCVVTESNWAVGHGDVNLADAPAFDCTNGIDAVRGAAGDRWTFDVSTLDVEAIPGVAIVPDRDAMSPQFQIVFRVADSQEEGS